MAADVPLQGRAGGTAEAFRFPAVRVPTKEVIFQRYVDAGLAPVGAEVSLEATYGRTAALWPWFVGGVVMLLLVLAVLLVVLLRMKPPAAVERRVPQTLDPFVAAAILREIRARPEVTDAQRAALDADVAAIEVSYFAAGAGRRRTCGRWSSAGRR